MLQCVHDVLDPGKNEVDGRDNVVLVGNHVSGSHPHGGIAPVQFKRRVHMPAVSAMGRPHDALTGFDMNQDANAGLCQRCPIEIKVAVELCMSGEFWIDSGTAQKI